MKKAYLLLFFICSFSYGQYEKEIDSLNTIISKTKDVQIKVDSYRELTQIYITTDLAKAQSKINELKNLNKNNSCEKCEAMSDFLQARYYSMSIESSDKIIKCYKKSIDRSFKNKDYDFYSIVMMHLINHYVNKNKMDEAEVELKKYFELTKKINFTDYYNSIYYLYGKLYKRKGYNNLALKNLILADKYFKYKFSDDISVRIGEHFSLGGGPIYASGSVNFNRNVDRSTTNSDGERTDLTIESKGISAWGYTAGFMFNPTNKLRIGMNYRSEIIMEARGGDADFNDVPVFAEADPRFQDQKFDADLPLPAELTVGLSYQVTDKWMLAFDYNRAMWGVYESLTVSFENGSTSVNPRNYQNASTYRVGTQYKANDKFTFRAGWYFDESPVQDGYFAPETPRNDSMGYTGGLTYQVNSKLGIDVSFLYLHFDEVDNSYDYVSDGSSFGGTYKSVVFSPGIGITYGF